MLKVLDLFSGIGGFSLGLERTGGFQTAAFCEIEPFPRRVLAKHWPNVPIYEDVRELTAERLRADGVCVDVICGGFPCQDISRAGHRVGIGGERSGLWVEYARLIRELRPKFVLVENVADLLGRGIGDVLADLAEMGFSAEWGCIRASDAGLDHQRDRVWIVAYSEIIARPLLPLAQPLRNHRVGRVEVSPGRRDRGANAGGAGAVCAPRVVGKPDGVPNRVDRIRALGNAVVPQIPEMIGRAILARAA